MVDKTQDYRVVLIFKNKGNNSPAEWLHDAIEHPSFDKEVETVYSTEVETINRQDDKWKWLNDIDDLNTHIKNNKNKTSVKTSTTVYHPTQSESEIMQDQLEPIYHPTQYDESDDLENTKNIEQVEALNNHSSSNWAQHEEELKYIREKLERLEKWHNQVSNSKET
jgi:hypothetical protein